MTIEKSEDTHEVTMLKLKPIMPSNPKDRLSSKRSQQSIHCKKNYLDVESNLTLLVPKTLQTDIFISCVVKDLVILIFLHDGGCIRWLRM